MSADSVYIINRFAQQGTLKVQITNVPDTMNVSVSDMDIYSAPLSHIDSLVTQIAQLNNVIPADSTCSDVVYDILTRIALPLLIALIAMAAPLLLYNINGLDTKYHSTRVINVFKKSIIFRLLLISIPIVALIIVLKILTWQTDWSSHLFIATSISLLIIIVGLCGLIFAFYSYPLLIRYILFCYKTRCSLYKNKVPYFDALTDCLHYAILQNDKQKAKELLDFFREEFAKERKGVFDKKDYPDEYYNYILETTEYICRNNCTNVLYQDSEGDYILPISFIFPDKRESESGIIMSEQSYITIWKTLLMFCNYHQEKLFISYWDCINTYYSYKLSFNQADEFIEFHEYVGALLIAHNQYGILHDLILWTNKKKTTNNFFSFPNIIISPSDKLIPMNAEDLLLRYIRLMHSLDKNENKYILPNIAATSEMPNPLAEYCKRYIALLYLLSCNPKDKQTLFFYEEGQDLQLPESTTIQTIEKLTKELYHAAKLLMENDVVKNTFYQLSRLVTIPSLDHFIEVVSDNFSLHVRTQDIKPTVLAAINQILTKKTEEAFKKFPFASTTNARGKVGMIKKGVNAPHLYTKADLSGEALMGDIRTSIGNEVYCSIIRSAFDVVKEFSPKRITNCPKDLFKQSLDETIATIKYPSEYILVCEDSRLEDVLKGMEGYHNMQYNGVDVILSTIYFTSQTTAQAWLIKKSDLPVYKIESVSAEMEIHNYMFKPNEDAYHSQSIVLDLGRVTPPVLEQLKKEIPEYMIPSGKNLEELVLVAQHIPLNIYAKKSASTIMQWNISEIPLQSKMNWDYADDDSYDQPEDPLTAHLITPDDFNKALGLKRARSRNTKKTTKKQ